MGSLLFRHHQENLWLSKVVHIFMNKNVFCQRLYTFSWEKTVFLLLFYVSVFKISRWSTETKLGGKGWVGEGNVTQWLAPDTASTVLYKLLLEFCPLRSTIDVEIYIFVLVYFYRLLFWLISYDWSYSGWAFPFGLTEVDARTVCSVTKHVPRKDVCIFRQLAIGLTCEPKIQHSRWTLSLGDAG